jgi:outer membrane murein-binding lipoprotein Lpp
MVKKQISVSYQSFMKRISALFLVVIAGTLLTGCITFLTEIKVRGDGSGTMVQTMTINPEQMKKSMEGIAKQMGATTTGSEEDAKKNSSKASEEYPFKEDDLKGKAADLGLGVTFVSVEKIDTKTAAGVRVTYAFKDINQLAVNPKPAAAMGTAGAGASSQDALKFLFNRKPNGNAVLTVVLARPKPEAANEQAAKPLPPASPEAANEQAAKPLQPASPEESAQQMAMMKQMFKGLHMGMSVDVAGKVVKTNSLYVEGSKVTLMDIDFDPLLSDDEGFKTLSAKMETAMGDDRKIMEALKGIKGLKITTDPEISIEFAPE